MNNTYHLISFIKTIAEIDGKDIEYAYMFVLDPTEEKEEDQKQPIKLKVKLASIDNLDEVQSLKMGTLVELGIKPDRSGTARVGSIKKA